MKVSVWDTYVKRDDGKIMHFDILVPSDFTNKADIFNFGNEYLSAKPFSTKKITTKECKLCHIENATQEIEDSIKEKGYYIIEMENFN